MLNKERFNILDIIYNSVKDISSHCDNINYMVNISLEESVDPSYVVADRARIYQVVSNLLTNAGRWPGYRECQRHWIWNRS